LTVGEFATRPYIFLQIKINKVKNRAFKRSFYGLYMELYVR
jgi:hypothetical protein